MSKATPSKNTQFIDCILSVEETHVREKEYKEIWSHVNDLDIIKYHVHLITIVI